MADLKKKFIDILFEDDDEEDVVVDNSSIKSNVKASELLYHKSTNSVFVNLDEPKMTSVGDDTRPETSYEQYEMSAQISPMFGVIKAAKKDDGVILSKETIDSQTNKPSNSHLDIITSPIFGYGSKEDIMNDALKNKLKNENYNFDEIKRVEPVKKDEPMYTQSEDEALHVLFDDDNHINESFDQLKASETEEINLFKLFEEDK